jgi:hypothetical protein
VKAGAYLALLALAACGSPAAEKKQEGAVETPVPSGPPVAQQVDAAPPATPGAKLAPAWEAAASGDGTALRLTGADGGLMMSLACLSGPARLVATVPSFAPIGSEDRFSLGLGSEPVTLVADPTRQGDKGVSAEGPAPDKALLEDAETVSALYGTQQLGPVPAPPKELKALLAKACT